MANENETASVQEDVQQQPTSLRPEEILKRPWGHAVIDFISAMETAKQVDEEAQQKRNIVLPGIEQKMRLAHIELCACLDRLSIAMMKTPTPDDELWGFAVHVGTEGLTFFNTLVGTMMAQRAAITQTADHQYERACRETYRLFDKAIGR